MFFLIKGQTHLLVLSQLVSSSIRRTKLSSLFLTSKIIELLVGFPSVGTYHSVTGVFDK